MLSMAHLDYVVNGIYQEVGGLDTKQCDLKQKKNQNYFAWNCHSPYNTFNSYSFKKLGISALIHSGELMSSIVTGES